MINTYVIRYFSHIKLIYFFSFQSNDHWVSVHNLRTINDGGILDPDDQLNDVVDDREQVNISHPLMFVFILKMKDVHVWTGSEILYVYTCTNNTFHELLKYTPRTFVICLKTSSESWQTIYMSAALPSCLYIHKNFVPLSVMQIQTLTVWIFSDNESLFKNQKRQIKCTYERTTYRLKKKKNVTELMISWASLIFFSF